MAETVSNNNPPDTESRILIAAEQEFMAKGYAGARTTSIAEAAGVTHAMLHYYFRTKDKLFERIIAEKTALLKELMLGSIDSSDLPLDTLITTLISRHIDFIAANPGLPRFMVVEVFGNSERLAVMRNQLINYAPGFIADLQRRIDADASRGICRQVDAVMLLIDIVSLNLFSFMSAPLFNAILGAGFVGSPEFVELRKKENIETIMRKLKP
ncbi:MAG: TetR/AcrR family transcriptional regulator [Paramuribaculum sp.]|nr:TetR/AcrR family transcriptional regulator [Paramuribaculum sp.]